jgi:hypothetical protein
VVQHVKEIGVEPQLEPLVNEDGLEQRRVQIPLANPESVI